MTVTEAKAMKRLHRTRLRWREIKQRAACRHLGYLFHCMCGDRVCGVCAWHVEKQHHTCYPPEVWINWNRKGA